MCKEVGAPTPEPNDPGWGPLAAQVTLQGSEVVVAHQRAKPRPLLAQDSCHESPGASQFLPKFAAEGPRLNSSGASREAWQNPEPKPKQEGTQDMVLSWVGATDTRKEGTQESRDGETSTSKQSWLTRGPRAFRANSVGRWGAFVKDSERARGAGLSLLHGPYPTRQETPGSKSPGCAAPSKTPWVTLRMQSPVYFLCRGEV